MGMLVAQLLVEDGTEIVVTVGVDSFEWWLDRSTELVVAFDSFHIGAMVVVVVKRSFVVDNFHIAESSQCSMEYRQDLEFSFFWLVLCFVYSLSFHGFPYQSTISHMIPCGNLMFNVT